MNIEEAVGVTQAVIQTLNDVIRNKLWRQYPRYRAGVVFKRTVQIARLPANVSSVN